MRPWHLELLEHAFDGDVIRLIPTSDLNLARTAAIQVQNGVFVPCFSGANDNPYAWMWRTGPDSCRHTAPQQKKAHIWTVLDRMQASLQTQANGLVNQVPAMGELLFSKRRVRARARARVGEGR
eukprot:TRINITY_DN6961_c0_g3_i1.p1 TRINITY_DN6961_c0_g3~~TRINITY_DN6961_c0_g3_i1.p1  ORF type:complete len:124 (+),score=11.89 TRINITY_DN6961_c0_g3_i1:561-932(+)